MGEFSMLAGFSPCIISCLVQVDASAARLVAQDQAGYGLVMETCNSLS